MVVRLLGVSGVVAVGSVLLWSCSDGGGSAENGKPDAGGDSGSDSASTPCKTDEFRCVGDALETCTADQTHFQPVATCKAGLCDAEGKQCDNCVAGDGACEPNGTSYKACDATGQKEQATTCTGATPFCTDKAGKASCVACKVASDCPPSASECSLAACSTEGACGVSAVAKGAPCGAAGAGGSCDGAGACVYCTPGEKRCTGLVPETCDAKSQWSAAAACSGADPICLAGACVQCTATADCAASTNDCLSATCASNKCGYSPQAQGTACGSGSGTGTCNGSGQCNVCQPGSKTCNGNVPLVCGSNGQYSAQTACGGGTPECDPASGSCVQCTSLAQCPTSSNPCLSPLCTTGSCGFAPKAAGTTCPGGTCSATGVCQICTPGTKTCSGNSVLTCNAQGQYDAPVPCSGGTPVCAGGVCQAGPICGNGTPEGTEQCDDGNATNSDLCSATCKVCDPPITALTNNGAGLGDGGSYAGWALGGQASVEFWVRFKSPSASDMAVSTAYDDSSTGGWFCLATPTQVSFTLRYADPTAELNAAIAPALDVWHHVACQYDGGTMRLFLDGSQVGSKAATGSLHAYSQHLLILHRNKWVSAMAGGYAAREIRIGNQVVYSGAFKPSWTLAPVAGTVALYHLNEGSGSTLASAVSGAPSLLLTGTTSWTGYGSACQ